MTFLRPRVLMLQGPVGPFFGELHQHMTATGFDVKRVLFNAGDSLFRGKGNNFRFSGTVAEWEAWLEEEVKRNRPDTIIMFGTMRPIHQVARRVAQAHDVAVLSMEEGYLRAGYISCELGGNNQHSPMCNWYPGAPLGRKPVMAADIKSSFVSMSFWAALYYLTRDAFSRRGDTPHFHKARENVVALSARWVVHMARRNIKKYTEAATIARLTGPERPKYILVPLQVPTDSQVKTAARGWNSELLVEAAIRALVLGPGDQELVIKMHPLDRTEVAMRKLVADLARRSNVQDRVTVVSSGGLSEMAEAASGMIVINSTSAFSALHHGLPVLVLGDAIFRHEALVTVGETQADIETFFQTRKAKKMQDIDSFLESLRATALLPGDFYRRSGREIAAREVSELAEALVYGNQIPEAAE